LSGEFTSGDHVLVEAGTDGLVLSKVAAPAPEPEAARSETDESVPSAS
jgi:hypothetical protein